MSETEAGRSVTHVHNQNALYATDFLYGYDPKIVPEHKRISCVPTAEVFLYLTELNLNL